MAKKSSKPASTPKTPASKPTGKMPVPRKPAKGDDLDFNAIAAELEGSWEQSRAKEPASPMMGPPDVPDGDYLVRLTGARVGRYRSGNRKGTGYLRFRYTILAGEYAGEVLSSSDDLSNREVGTQGNTALDMLSERLQRMGVATKKLSIKNLPDLCEWLLDPAKNPDAKPCYRVAVRNNYVESDKGETLRFQNVYINETLSNAEVEELDANA